jgi:transposase-like protein
MEKNFQLWTAKRKMELVLSLLKGEMTQVEACRQYDLKQSEVESWTETFLKSGEHGLKSNSKDQQLQHEKEVKELQAKVGELVMELDARKKLEALLESQEN